MSEQGNRAVVEQMAKLTQDGRLEEVVEHYHDDVVVEYPQSGERVEGKENIREVYRNFPEGSPTFTPREIRTAGDLVISESTGEYGDGSTWFATSILQFRDGKVARETSYFGQTFPAPEWRAKWVTKL